MTTTEAHPKDIAPEIFRQRLLIEGFFAREIDEAAVRDYLLGLARELGLGVGISSGANFLAALDVQRRLGDGALVVTVFPDDNKKYLSTDLLRDEPVKPSFLSPHIDLKGFTVFQRIRDSPPFRSAGKGDCPFSDRVTTGKGVL